MTEPGLRQPYASTFSIVAADPGRRACGVAVQSKFLAIGAVSAWAEPGVGAGSTQALINVAYGRDGLRALRGGDSPEQVVGDLTAADPGRAGRQLGVVDAGGRSATYTGAECAEWAGGRAGPGCAVQGNLLVSAATVEATWDRFHASEGEPLAERLLAALQAGQAAGGDRRGEQSAALIVVEPGGGYGGGGLVVDLRVDDHEAPMEELARLYELHRRYFGSTPLADWISVSSNLAAEVDDRLDALGYRRGDLGTRLMTWAAVENLEERVAGSERIDPVVLAELRRVSG